jgi:hypothetical protein
MSQSHCHNTQQTTKADTKEDQRGERARPPRLSIVFPTVRSPMPLSRLIYQLAIARINGEFANTRLSQATKFLSSAATKSPVSKEPQVHREGQHPLHRGLQDSQIHSREPAAMHARTHRRWQHLGMARRVDQDMLRLHDKSTVTSSSTRCSGTPV